MPTFECPTCQKIVRVALSEEAPYRPFCCARCKLIDLGRWLDGTYTVSEPITPEEWDGATQQEAEDSDD